MEYVTISEYGYIGCDSDLTNKPKFVGKRDLKKELFKELHDFWNSDKETQKVFTFENKQCLKATSYVGIIQTKNLSIEILPKIYQDQGGSEETKNTYRNIFIEMLKPLLNINEIQISKASLSTTKNKNIYEMFISMFIQHMDKLIHRGLKSQYIAREDNQYFLKGKLKFNEHIKQNYIHKERFYVEFDEYLQDRVENRLLKSAIALLLKKTNDYENKRALRQQLFVFDEVGLSTAHDVDFKKVDLHRGMEYYDLPMRFAEVFLKHQSFTSLRGKDDVFALLFPMEKVFEKYMEFVLNNSKGILGIKKVLPNGYTGDWLLGNNDCNIINQQPDYILEMSESKKIVADAKWKLFDVVNHEDRDCDKISVSSSDMYQIFSYLNYYDNVCDTAYIFAPKFGDFTTRVQMTYKKRNGKDTDKKVVIFPINLALLTKSHRLLDKDIICQN